MRTGTEERLLVVALAVLGAVLVAAIVATCATSWAEAGVNVALARADDMDRPVPVRVTPLDRLCTGNMDCAAQATLTCRDAGLTNGGPPQRVVSLRFVEDEDMPGSCQFRCSNGQSYTLECYPSHGNPCWGVITSDVCDPCFVGPVPPDIVCPHPPGPDEADTP